LNENDGQGYAISLTLSLSSNEEYSKLTNFMKLSPSRGAANCAATQELPSIYGRFNTVFTRALHWSLS
jgi:hypothetical protein